MLSSVPERDRQRVKGENLFGETKYSHPLSPTRVRPGVTYKRVKKYRSENLYPVTEDAVEHETTF